MSCPLSSFQLDDEMDSLVCDGGAEYDLTETDPVNHNSRGNCTFVMATTRGAFLADTDREVYALNDVFVACACEVKF